MMRFWKDWVDTQLKSSYDTMRSKPWYQDDVSPSESAEITTAFLSWAAFIYDIHRQTSRLRSINYCVNAVEDIFDWVRMHGAAVYFSVLKDIVLKFRHSASLRAFVVPDGDSISLLIWRVIEQLWDLPDVERFRSVHGILVYLEKMAFPNPHLKDQELESWKNQELSISWSYTPFLWPVQAVITEWFADFQVGMLKGSFSNGSTANAGASLYRKITSRGSLNFSSLCWLYQHTDSSFMFQGGDIPAKMIFVPKNALHLRGISMEPADKNYWQSALNEQILRHIAPLNEHIRLDDQDYSRDACLHALENGLCTVDLSAASDSVTLQWVKVLFARVPLLLDALLALRSKQTTLPDGTVWTLRKYAPMGSKLTFTLECVIFSAICEASYRLRGIPRSQRQYVVYGDDIIIRSDQYPLLRSMLTSFGFRVNDQKSFHTGFFREACGLYAYKDTNVTLPAYGRKAFAFFSDHSAQELALLTQTANILFVNGLPLTRYLWAREACRNNHLKFHLADDLSMKSVVGIKDNAPVRLNEFYLLSDTPSNYRLRKKTVVSDWQPTEDYSYVDSYEYRTVSRWLYDVPLEVYLMDTDMTRDDSRRYLVMLYRMAHTIRQPILPGIEEPMVVAGGEVIKDSPVVARWKRV